MNTIYHRAADAARRDYANVSKPTPIPFEQLVAETREKRATFERLFRETCLALGEFCRAVDATSNLANALARENTFGMLPEHHNTLQELSQPPIPKALLVGLEPTMGLGWNWSVPCMAAKQKLGG